MLVRNIISQDVPELTLKDQPVNALNLMDEFKVSHLPVVEHGRYLGLVSEEELEVLEPSKNGTLCAHHELMDIKVEESQHILHVLSLAAEHHLTVIPVVKDDMYEGSITLTDLIDAFANSQSAMEAGSIIVLTMIDIDYSMQEIARIVEENDAKILSSNLSSVPGSREIEVTLKVDKEDPSAIVQTFNRFDYNVTVSFHKSSYSDDLKNRYDEFMKYLNI